MLDQSISRGPVTANPALPAWVEQLTEEDEEFFEKRGPISTTWEEPRRFVRFYHRSLAQMDYLENPPALRRRAPSSLAIVTLDLSREGIGFLHSEQLFPGERHQITLADGVPRKVEIVWCRRWRDTCFAVGSRFV